MTGRSREIGGYFALECREGEIYHASGTFLNSGRNALRHILRCCGVRELYVPFYTCPVVIEAIKEEKAVMHFYDVTPDLVPDCSFPADAFILYTNYFGVCGKTVRALAQKYPNLIVDNAQSFYSAPCGLGSFYSPRKFFGLPDGGIAFCRKETGENSYPDETDSHSRFAHLLIRHELGAQAGYAHFAENDGALDGREIRKMSLLTRKLMGNIDYERAKKCRLENFRFLAEALEPEKKWDLLPGDVPMVYPFYTSDSELRSRLIEKKIFAATYWKGTDKSAEALTSSIIPLPIDQRYGLEEMKFIAETVLNSQK